MLLLASGQKIVGKIKSGQTNDSDKNNLSSFCQIFHINNVTTLPRTSVTRLGDFLHFGQLF